MNNLTNLSPLDGRYSNSTKLIADSFSEYALIKYRLIVEIEWLKALSANETIEHINKFTKQEIDFLNLIIKNFNHASAAEIKKIESITKHDVKAVEYYLKEKLKTHTSLAYAIESIHFALTSEDVNNIAYSLMLKEALTLTINPILLQLQTSLNNFAQKTSKFSILAKTHGQPASTSTLGKEIAVFSYRLNRQIKQLSTLEILAKCNGAVGNYNAHYIAYPNIDWQQFSKDFLQTLGLEQAILTTQIESHDNLAEHAHLFVRINMILLDLSQDLWGYISSNYLKQKISTNQIGSSTMPHKINPIDFENAEGNLGIANALLNHFATKLTKSRFQRDLSDSTVMRNIGVAFGHCYLSYLNLIKGLDKLEINPNSNINKLEQNWQILAEPVQTIMRKYKIENSYEKLKDISQEKVLTKAILDKFIEELNIPQYEKAKLYALTPENYIGFAGTVNSLLDNLS